MLQLQVFLKNNAETLFFRTVISRITRLSLWIQLKFILIILSNLSHCVVVFFGCGKHYHSHKMMISI